MYRKDNVMTDKKKIGILTFYHTTNYGALLQMYALYHKIVEKGCNIDIIRYTCDAVERRENLSLLKSKNPKQFLRTLLLKMPNSIKQKNFRKFEENKFVFSEQIYTAEALAQLSKKYDSVIVGSDQVWNLKLTGNDMGFFLMGVSGIKKYAYAASFGSESVDTYTAQKIAKSLKEFDLISVRETSAIDIVNNICRIKPYFVLDPTFLLTADEWRGIAEKKIKKEKPYILLYLIQNKKKTIAYAKKIAKKNGWNVKYINISPYHVNSIDNIRSVDPNEFLKLIDNASLVITGSYHGLALSVNLSKPLHYQLSEKKNNYNVRISSLINTLELEECKLDYEKTDIPNIKYDRIQKKLSTLREQSNAVLNLIINQGTGEFIND